jgi:hypothetical protein
MGTDTGQLPDVPDDIYNQIRFGLPSFHLIALQQLSLQPVEFLLGSCHGLFYALFIMIAGPGVERQGGAADALRHVYLD